MFRARERGMSFWPFVVSLLLVIVLVVMWFSATSERDQWKASFEKAEGIRKTAEAGQLEKITALQELSKRVGWTGGGNTSDPAQIDKDLKDTGTRLGDILTIEFDADRYQEDANGGKPEKTAAGKVKVRYLTEAELADAATLQALISKFEVAANRMKNDVLREVEYAKKAQDDKEAAAKAGADALAAKEKRIAELTSEKATIDQAAHEKETELNEKVAQKDQALQKANSDADEVRKQAATNEAKLIAQNNEKDSTIRSLVQRDAPTLTEGPDGEVVVAQDGIAIINRGKTNWLMPGTVFDVLGRSKGGATYKKGSIKVTSCDDESARAAILDEKANDPITRGDLIQSLTYSPNRKLHFVLVGDFKKMGKSQAEAVLKRLGAVVDAKVTAETNYVVVGAAPAGADNLDDNDAVKAAKELSIRMITEDALSSFCRY